MSIDPDEIKKSAIKRSRQIAEIQNYMEEQEALDKNPGIGALGAHRVKVLDSEEGKISPLTKMILNNQKLAGTDVL
jgi:hypothetical protein